MTPEDEEEPRELQAARAQDWEHVQLHPSGANLGAVVTVWFTAEELDRVAAAADRRDPARGGALNVLEQPQPSAAFIPLTSVATPSAHDRAAAARAGGATP